MRTISICYLPFLTTHLSPSWLQHNYLLTTYCTVAALTWVISDLLIAKVNSLTTLGSVELSETSDPTMTSSFPNSLST